MIDYRQRFGARVADMWATVRPESPGLRVQAAASGDAVELLIYDAIGADPWGEGVDPKAVLAALAEAGDKPVVARINSPGGDVFAGLAIYNALKAHAAGAEIRVDGLAASAASIIAMAGTCTMAQASQLMIHNSWTLAIGNAADLQKTAAVMQRIDGQMAGIYADKSGKTVEECAALMDAETWMTGQEAVDAGLADAVDKPAKKTKAAAPAEVHAEVEPTVAPAIDHEATAARERAVKVRQARLKIALAE